MYTFKWFAGCETPDQVRKKYRRLAFQHHPDRGGDTRTMQDINAEYDEVMRSFSGETFSNASGSKDYTYTYNQTTESRWMETLMALLALRMRGVTIEIVGTWIWVYGNTKIYKETLKTLGLRWSGKRKKWYYTTSRKSGRMRYKRASFDTLRGKYGSMKMQEETA